MQVYKVTGKGKDEITQNTSCSYTELEDSGYDKVSVERSL